MVLVFCDLGYLQLPVYTAQAHHLLLWGVQQMLSQLETALQYSLQAGLQK